MKNNPKKAEEMYSDTWSGCMSYSDFLFKQNEDLRKQIERLQGQLNEANEVIKTTNTLSGRVDLSPLPYLDRRRVDGITMETVEYMDKWGVK